MVCALVIKFKQTLSKENLGAVFYWAFLFSSQNALERHNQTVAEMNQLELDTEYDGIFSSALSATLGLVPLVGTLGVKAISTGLNWYKKVKVREAGAYMKFSKVPCKNYPITSLRFIPCLTHPWSHLAPWCINWEHQGV